MSDTVPHSAYSLFLQSEKEKRAKLVDCYHSIIVRTAVIDRASNTEGFMTCNGTIEPLW